MNLFNLLTVKQLRDILEQYPDDAQILLNTGVEEFNLPAVGLEHHIEDGDELVLDFSDCVYLEFLTEFGEDEDA